MSFDNRIVRQFRTWVDADGQQHGEHTYGIHEAYYDSEGKVLVVTKDAIRCQGYTLTKLRGLWCMMAEAFGQPILDFDRIPEEGHDQDDLLVSSTNPTQALNSNSSEEGSSDGKVEDQQPVSDDHKSATIENSLPEELRKEEQKHHESIAGIQSFEALVSKIFSDHRESLKG